MFRAVKREVDFWRDIIPKVREYHKEKRSQKKEIRELDKKYKKS